MSNLQNAIDYIESKLNKRNTNSILFTAEDSTALVRDEAEHVLALLRAHAVEEDALQFDMEMTELRRRMV